MELINLPAFNKNQYCFLYNDQKQEFQHSYNKIYNLHLYENSWIFIQPNDIVFDCGGNFGLFAAYAANKGAIVYSFEPMSLARIYLRETQKLYPDNIIIVPYAVGAENKIIKFSQCTNIAASGYQTEKFINTNKLYDEYVNMICLDDFIMQYNIIPTFIKADIEGMELDLLKGLQQSFKNYNLKFAISIHKNNIIKLKYIQSLLISKNYQLFYNNIDTENIIILGKKE